MEILHNFSTERINLSVLGLRVIILIIYNLRLYIINIITLKVKYHMAKQSVRLTNASVVAGLNNKVDIDYNNALVTSTNSNTPRHLNDRFSDIVNVKDFGAVGDGVHDDTNAFIEAHKVSNFIYIPIGTYSLNNNFPDILANLVGEGTLSFSNGRKMCLRNIANNDNIYQEFVSLLDLKKSGRAIQDISYCDGYLFVCQPKEDHTADYFATSNHIYITQYQYQDVNNIPLDITKNNFYMSTNEIVENIPSAWKRIKTVTVEAVGHGNCQAIKEGNDIYIYGQVSSDNTTNKGNGFSKFKWPIGTKNTISANEITYYSPLNGIRNATENAFQCTISEDGKLIVFASVYECVIYNLKDITLGNLSTIEPISRFYFNEQYRAPRSGIACDGKYIYILYSRYENATDAFIDIFSLSGTLIKQFSTNTIGSFVPKHTETISPDGWMVFNSESEGLAIVGSKILVGTRVYACKPSTVITYLGKKYTTRQDIENSTTPPLVDSTWVPLPETTTIIPSASVKNILDTSSKIWDYQGEWVSGKNYTGAQRDPNNTSSALANARFFITAFSTSFNSENNAPVYLDFHRVRPISTTINSNNGSQIVLGTIYNNSIYNPVFSSWPNNFRLYTKYDTNYLTFTFNNDKLALSTNTTALISFCTGKDNVTSLGFTNNRWSQIYSGTSTINTSDEREKTSIKNVDESLMKAWSKVDFKSFKFIDAVEKKGKDNARVHFGVIAQQVKEAFESEGLDASNYALFCYDEWDDEYEEKEIIDIEAAYDEEGNEVSPTKTHIEKVLVTPAGNRYGIRYSEALALECAYQRWKLNKLEEKLNNL